MGGVQSIKTGFGNCIDFSGRALGSEGWWPFLVQLLTSTIIVAGRGAIFRPSVKVGEEIRPNSRGTREPDRSVRPAYDGGLFRTVFLRATFCLLLATTWRRLQGTRRPGWMSPTPIGLFVIFFGLAFLTRSVFFTVLAFVSFLISLVIVLITRAQKSFHGPNVYGPNPHEVVQ